MYLHGVHREENLTLKSVEMNSAGIWHGVLWSKMSSCILDLVGNVPELTGLPSSMLVNCKKCSKVFWGFRARQVVY
jgi:hypothetical protein